MRVSRKNRMKTDFLIVGGGIAGVSALAEAGRSGINAICLEARPRIGGRIRTVRDRRMADYPLELGAEFVHGTLMTQVCQRLGLSLIKHPSDGMVFLDGELRPLLPILQALKQIRERAASHLASGELDCSVEEFIQSLPMNELNLPNNVGPHLLLQLIRNDYATRVSDLGLIGLMAPDVDGYENNCRIVEGFGELVLRLGADGDIRCNHIVSAIVWYRDGIDVITNRGIYSGNKIIVCLPVGVLQAGAVTFDPALSRAKAAAFESVIPGAATKLILCFRRIRPGATFWPESMPLLATSLATQLWWPTGWGRDDQRRFLASCLVGGAGVQRFAGREPREVGVTQLAHMFGAARVRGKMLSASFQKAWHDDPFTRGGYSSLPVGVDHAALLREFSLSDDQTHPGLFFAGDYVTEHPGATHSAFQSGIDAVNKARRAGNQ
jgi:monoamine oxidase